MRHPRKSVRPIAGAAAAFVVLALLVVLGHVLPLDVDRFRPRFESAASSALGMEVRVAGHLRARLGAGVLLSVEDIQILDARHAVIASVTLARFWIQPLSLLRGQLRLRRIELMRPTVTLERDGSGRFNVAGLEKSAALTGALDGARLSLTGGKFYYADAASGARLTAEGIGIDIRRLRLADGTRPLVGTGFALEARLSCAALGTQAGTLTDVSAVAVAKGGIIEINQISLRAFDGRGSGTLRADLTGATPRYDVRCSLAGFRIEQFLATRPGQPPVRGAMDFNVHLAFAGRTRAQLVGTLTGDASLHGRQITLLGDDLDRRFSRFESTQGFNFVDVGAAVLAGPIGLAVTRGYGILGLFRGAGGNSTIEVLASDWTIADGVARAADVAMATRRHRLALEGRLDFVNERFVDVSVATVAPGGCARVRQAMHGSFANPVLEQPRLLTSLAGPVLHLYRQVRGLLPERPCTVFYAGSVPPPS